MSGNRSWDSSARSERAGVCVRRGMFAVGATDRTILVRGGNGVQAGATSNMQGQEFARSVGSTPVAGNPRQAANEPKSSDSNSFRHQSQLATDARRRISDSSDENGAIFHG